MKNHSFDDLVKQKALQHEAPVPAGTWEAIAPKKKKRRFIIFWWITGVALLSGFILWQSDRKDRGRETVIASAEAKNKQQTEKKNADNTSGNADHDINKTVAKVNNNNTDKIKQNDTDGSITGTDTQKDVKQKQEIKEKTTLLALPGSAKKDKRSSSASAISNGRTATLSVRSATETNQPIESNSHIRMKATDFSITTDYLSPLDLKLHAQIAQFDIRKNILLSASSINSLIRNKADSIDAVTSAMAIDAKKKIKRYKWTIEASVMPFLPVQQDQSLLYMTRSNKGDLYNYEFKSDKIKTQLQPSLAYTVAIYKKINPRLRIGAGIQYAMVKEKVDLTGKETRTNYTQVQRLENNGSGPQIVIDTVITTSTGTLTVDALNSYKFISIPLSVQYTLMQRRAWALQVNGGLLMNISATYHNSIEGDLIRFDNNGMHTGKQGNAIGIDLFAGLRISRSYGAFRLFAEPILRFNTRRYDLNDMISRKYLHQAGLSFGVTYLLSY